MKRVYYNEFNILMGNTTYLPLVSGLLHAFALSRPTVTEKYEFQPYLFHVDRPESILEQYENPAVAAFSVCMWNEQLNLKIEEHNSSLEATVRSRGSKVTSLTNTPRRNAIINEA